jgi:RNA polymerase sigma-70 factor, ECF subfamily
LQTATATVTRVEAPIPSPAGDVEQLFRDHHAMVFRTAYRITGNASDAEDVLQTVFMRLAARDPAAPALGRSESYLRRAAINAALDIGRSRAVGGGAPLEDSLADRSRPETERRELRECLRHALARLAPRDAEVFTLRFLEGYSNPEIAQMLGVSKVWVAVTVYRTRRRLQKEIPSYLGGKS